MNPLRVTDELGPHESCAAPALSMLEAIRVRIGDNTRAALGDASRQGRLPSEVARALALERLDKAVATRRWSVFAGYGNTGRDSAEPRTTREA